MYNPNVQSKQSKYAADCAIAPNQNTLHYAW